MLEICGKNVDAGVEPHQHQIEIKHLRSIAIQCFRKLTSHIKKKKTLIFTIKNISVISF